MRAKVTNTSQTTICRGAMVFRGGSVSEVVISNEYSLSEIRACRELKVEVLEDKMTTAAPVEAPVVEPVPFMEPAAPVVEPVPFMEPPMEPPMTVEREVMVPLVEPPVVLEDKMTPVPVAVEVPFVEPHQEMTPVPVEKEVEIPFVEPQRYICECGFVGKSLAGLKAHQRTRNCA